VASKDDRGGGGGFRPAGYEWREKYGIDKKLILIMMINVIYDIN
jgi:hypothetical protein